MITIKKEMILNKLGKHYDNYTLISASAREVFQFADDHANFSSHMTKSSWMMMGGKMKVKTDEGQGQKVGSHISLSGKVFGINLFLDEVVTQHKPPYFKAWQTVGGLSLLIIGHYKMGFNINPQNSHSKLEVYIDYELPQSFKTRLLSLLFGEIYAKWCVNQMINGIKAHFK